MLPERFLRSSVKEAVNYFEQVAATERRLQSHRRRCGGYKPIGRQNTTTANDFTGLSRRVGTAYTARQQYERLALECQTIGYVISPSCVWAIVDADGFHVPSARLAPVIWPAIKSSLRSAPRHCNDTILLPALVVNLCITSGHQKTPFQLPLDKPRSGNQRKSLFRFKDGGSPSTHFIGRHIVSAVAIRITDAF